jgi:hypothetical protein
MLPVEIQRQIIEYIHDVTDLRNLRLVSRQITGYATEQLFRNIMLANNECSAKKLEKVLACASLASLVKSAVFDMGSCYYSGLSVFLEAYSNTEAFRHPDCIPQNFVYSAVHAVIKKMDGRCPNLSKITIRFSKDPKYRTDIMFHWQVLRTVIESLHHDRNTARQLHTLGITRMLYEKCIVFRLEPYNHPNQKVGDSASLSLPRRGGYVFHPIKVVWDPCNPDISLLLD